MNFCTPGRGGLSHISHVYIRTLTLCGRRCWLLGVLCDWARVELGYIQRCGSGCLCCAPAEGLSLWSCAEGHVCALAGQILLIEQRCVLHPGGVRAGLFPVALTLHHNWSNNHMHITVLFSQFMGWSTPNCLMSVL